jgi:hypothetical protein
MHYNIFIAKMSNTCNRILSPILLHLQASIHPSFKRHDRDSQFHTSSDRIFSIQTTKYIKKKRWCLFARKHNHTLNFLVFADTVVVMIVVVVVVVVVVAVIAVVVAVVRQQVPIVRHVQKLHEAETARDDGILVPFGVRTEKVRLDLIHLAGTGDPGNLVDFPTKVEQGRCQHDQASVGFEVHRVDLVKSQQGNLQQGTPEQTINKTKMNR